MSFKPRHACECKGNFRTEVRNGQEIVLCDDCGTVIEL